MANQSNNDIMGKLVSLCKRRGYVFPSSEIYGGIISCWDYGPLGVELKRNIKELWWRAMTLYRDDIEGLDCSIMMHPRVWEASGHVEGFTDPLLDCKGCRQRFREDEVKDKCPNCGGELTEARQFNLMFKTHMGPMEEDANLIYLRPETAQGIYVNFSNVRATSRRKIPFGIAQLGKAFRNEITPGNFIFRTREFEQMEMQYFVRPEEAMAWLERWKEERMNWYKELGIKEDKLRFHQHTKDELPHYAAEAYDIQYEFPFGWQELEGIHNRTDYDLKRHIQYSGKDLSYFETNSEERFIPYIIETSAGVERTLLTCLVDAYDEEPIGKPVGEEERVVLRLSPKLAPYKAGVFPLVKRDGMPEIAREIVKKLRPHFQVFYDEVGSIGRRYRRQDEAGTPYGITVDSQTLKDETVTLRDRDDMSQIRVKIEELVEKIGGLINQ
ncbi:glycine--tRNA ligase [candidate division NPL-UPA2 bacterium]|nr:glycine--tRNA ligase [candidate division NPL-UPA2 bacterium]